MDLDYPRCPAEIPDSLDARGHGDKCHYWALLLEPGVTHILCRHASWYPLGASMVGNEVYSRPRRR